MLTRKDTPHKLFSFLLFVSSMFILTACFSSMTPPEARVALDPAGTATATYKRGSLSVTYSYKSQNDILQISGEIQFQRAVDSLNVRLEFLNKEGKVLKRHLVYFSGHRVREREGSRRFDTTVNIPNGATAFAFSSTEQERTGR